MLRKTLLLVTVATLLAAALMTAAKADALEDNQLVFKNMGIAAAQERVVRYCEWSKFSVTAQSTNLLTCAFSMTTQGVYQREYGGSTKWDMVWNYSFHREGKSTVVTLRMGDESQDELAPTIVGQMVARNVNR